MEFPSMKSLFTRIGNESINAFALHRHSTCTLIALLNVNSETRQVKGNNSQKHACGTEERKENVIA